MGIFRFRAWIVVAMATSLAACGGPETVPLVEYAQQADTICAEATKKLDSLPQPNIDPANPDLSAVADLLEGVLGIIKPAVQQLHDLGTPDEQQDLARDWIAKQDQSITVAEDLMKAARSGDVVAFQTLSSKLDQINSQAQDQAAKLGMKDCAGE